MPAKPLPCPSRIRRVPEQFSSIDQRLVREHHIERCTHPAAALYLFLVTVADARGHSYYSEPAIMQRLSMSAKTLMDARENLIHADLVAFRHPFYQVLSIPAQAHTPNRAGTPPSPTPVPPDVSNSDPSSNHPIPANHYIQQMLRSLS